MPKLVPLIAAALLAIAMGKVIQALPTPDSPIVSRQESIAIGSVLGQGSIKVLDRPGLYGLGNPPEGSSYAISRGNLLRIDTATGAVQAVLRPWLTAVDRYAP